MSLSELQLNLLLSPEYMIERILEVHRAVRRHIREIPDGSFKPHWIRTARGLKPMAVVDAQAELGFIDAVTTRFGGRIVRVVGEESLYEGVDLQNEERTCILIDMIDGTDLLKRGFSNWCSAIVVFEPRIREIKGAFVALPFDYLYFATKEGAFKKRLSEVDMQSPDRLMVPNRVTDLRDASVCLYAQKSGNFRGLLALNEKNRFVSWLEENEARDRQLKETARGENEFRFYNLAGDLPPEN